jgi:hypothetical protein
MREWGLTPPQWRDLPEDDRELMLAESALVCQQCGSLKSVCGTPGRDLYPQREECYVTAARDLTMRRVAKKYKKEPNTAELHPLDGVSVWMADYDLAPEDTFFDLDVPASALPLDQIQSQEQPGHDDHDSADYG